MFVAKSGISKLELHVSGQITMIMIHYAMNSYIYIIYIYSIYMVDQVI